MLAACYRARRPGDAARLRHRQLRPGDAALRRRRPQPRRDEPGEVDRAAAASWPRPAPSSPRSTEQTRAQSGQELRLHPSTYNTASIAGFIAGGSGGVGSINWGGLRDLGNVLRAPRRHHGGRAARPRAHGPRPAEGDARLRHQRHHHRGRDAARRRLRLGRRDRRLRRLHDGGRASPTPSPTRTASCSRRSPPSPRRCPTTISCATRNSCGASSRSCC